MKENILFTATDSLDGPKKMAVQETFSKSNARKTFTVYSDVPVERLECRDFHLCSRGWEDELIFSSREEFICGMNMVACVVDRLDIKLLAFCLMNNHFHFIIAEKIDKVYEFSMLVSRTLKTRMRMIFNKVSRRKIIWSAFPIQDREYLMTSISYVLTNPVKAGIKQWITDYPWSNAAVLFRDSYYHEKVLMTSMRLGNLNYREYRSLICSKQKLPGDWLVTEEGFVWPGCYINWKEIEELYGDYNRFLYYVSSNKEKKKVQTELFCRQTGIDDIELQQHAIELCKASYHTECLTSLPLEDRLMLAKQLSLTYRCAWKQLCKILRLKYVE